MFKTQKGKEHTYPKQYRMSSEATPAPLRRTITMYLTVQGDIVTGMPCGSCEKKIPEPELKSYGEWHRCKIHFYCEKCVRESDCPSMREHLATCDKGGVIYPKQLTD